MPTPVSLDQCIAFLNEIIATDQGALRALMEYRVPCNDALASHPTVQVVAPEDDGEGYVVGLLGILNGLIGTDDDGFGFLCAVFSDDGTLERVQRTDPTMFKS